MPNQIPAYELTSQNRQVILARRPDGVPQASDFSLATIPVPKPAAGQFLVRNIYLSVDPAQRGWASAVANYSAPVALGTPMRALAVGVVVESGHVDYHAGDFLYGWFGWQHYVVAEPAQVVLRATHDLPLTAFASLLGINGITAFLGLTELGRPIASETLLVSTAAGSVGSFVGQIGRRMGARTIGLTGDDSKVARCKQRYGYDLAINYKAANLEASIATAAPDGIDIYFDNTGGSILDIVLRRMKVRGRIVQCGTASIPDWTVPPTGPRNEREILLRRLVWSGFLIFDYMQRYAQAADALAQLYRDGALVYDVDIEDGIDKAPGAIAALYAGENSGKKLIFVG
ncbi:MAG: NADP-dependent oxidoreductase [Hyphomicrobiales bacterium]|nr:NADP-dependent oxidoreductase [Hyphomicrobiales bacterium]MDE2115014.1 NADP-dependent oxidoreductase [Hyphomicrobiales bacterium]